MIKNFLKKSKGVTLISLSVAVIILLTITGTIIYNLSDNLKVGKLKKLQVDISNLSDKVAAYYAQYNDIPVYYITDEETSENTRVKYTNVGRLSNIVGANDGKDFYVIDLASLDNLTLNYGQDYELIKQRRNRI